MIVPVTIAILAGGRSSRFGGIDKQEIQLNGEALGRTAAKNALCAGCDVMIVGKNRRLYEGMPVGFAEDIRPGFGPLSGLHAALSCSRTEWILLIACDMPNFSLEWLKYLLTRAAEGSSEVVVAQSGRYIEPFQGLYSRGLLGRLEDIFADTPDSPGLFSFARLLREAPHHIVPEAVAREFSPDWKLFCNINSREDLERFLLSGNS
ncbi:MAG TPA: molybdenum cofactor guanylyltransferase [Rectinemataceae bacterium]|nr:molybdenum cofactor guanylyltransferase [Rectinemataceae bacterium]